MRELDEVGGIESRENGMKEVEQGSAVECPGEGHAGDPIRDRGRPCELERESSKFIAHVSS